LPTQSKATTCGLDNPFDSQQEQGFFFGPKSRLSLCPTLLPVHWLLRASPGVNEIEKETNKQGFLYLFVCFYVVNKAVLVAGRPRKTLK
jgi:hypothetical protein